MKKLIGVLVAVVAIIALLLSTCNGPAPDGTGGTAATVDAPSMETPAASPMPESAVEPTTEPEPVSVAPDRSPSDDPVASSTPNRDRPDYDRARRAAPPVVLAGLPVEDLPDAGIEALFAVHPRDLEGGSGASSGVMLVTPDSLRAQLRIAMPDRDWLPTDFTRGQPSSTINTPTAYGPRWGQVYVGAALQDRIRYSEWTDGVLSFGFGLGDPIKYVGLDVNVNILDTYTEFAKDRSLSLKLHRRLPYRTAIAVGHENAWHTDGTDGGSSRYLVVSKVVLLRDRPTSAFGSMVMNLGLGDDRFLPEMAFARGEDGVNAFGSLALRVHPTTNAIANWTGQDLALGLSIAPVRTWPLVITPAVVDVTGNAGDGARFSVSAGLNYTFR